MLGRLPRGLATAAVALALFGAIGVAGVVDHTLKQRRMNHAEVAEWYCAHTETHCAGPSSSRMEDAWNKRERGYQIALGVVAAGGAVLTIVARRRQRSDR